MKANQDGLSYSIDDYVETDRTHPTESGRMKVATRLMAFLKTDSTSKGWFLASAK
jgi:hypothetical protein